MSTKSVGVQGLPPLGLGGIALISRITSAPRPSEAGFRGIALTKRNAHRLLLAMSAAPYDSASDAPMVRWAAESSATFLMTPSDSPAATGHLNKPMTVVPKDEAN